MKEVWTPENLALALAEARRWAGTKHLNRRAIPGMGIDCVHLVAEILMAAKIVPSFKLPYYNQAMGMRAKANGIGSILECCFHGRWVAEPADGDIILFRVGSQSNHCGIMLGGRCWHVVTGRHVEADEMTFIGPKVERAFSLTEPGFKFRPEKLNTMEHLKIK